MLVACADNYSSSVPWQGMGYAQKVEIIDNESRKMFGVGILSLGVLANTDGNEYVLKESLDHSYLKSIEDLEKLGYVEVREIRAQEGIFVNLSLTDEGRELKGELGD